MDLEVSDTMVINPGWSYSGSTVATWQNLGSLILGPQWVEFSVIIVTKLVNSGCLCSDKTWVLWPMMTHFNKYFSSFILYNGNPANVSLYLLRALPVGCAVIVTQLVDSGCSIAVTQPESPGLWWAQGLLLSAIFSGCFSAVTNLSFWFMNILQCLSYSILLLVSKHILCSLSDKPS